MDPLSYRFNNGLKALHVFYRFRYLKCLLSERLRSYITYTLSLTKYVYQKHLLEHLFKPEEILIYAN